MININEAKTHLSKYTRRVKAGETIILCERNRPIAEIRPISDGKRLEKRKLGQLKAKVHCDEATFLEADKEIEANFSESEIFPKTSL